MRFFDYISIPFKNIMRQKLRSSLTIVAIVIGSLAVISVLSLVFGAEQAFRKQMESVGQFTVVQVTPDQQNMDGGPFGGQEVTDEKDKKKLDNAAMAKIREIPHVVGASAGVNVWQIQSISTLGGDGKKYRSELVATEQSDVMKKQIVAGRDFTSDDEKGKIVIGAHLVGSLGFKSPQEAIGKTLILTTEKGYQGEGAQVPGPNSNKDEWEKRGETVTELRAEIIGVTTPAAVGSSGGTFITMGWARKILSWSNWKEDGEKRKRFDEQRQRSEQQRKRQFSGKGKDYKFEGMKDPDSKQFMVLETQSEIDMKGYQFANIKVDDAANAKTVADAVKEMGLGASTADDFLKAFTNVAKIVGALLAALGAISLGVAAIGIVNTMAMAMLERTREIGIMRACGARRKTIRRLFTGEAAALGFCGGSAGIVLGIGLSKIANYFINNFLTAQSVSAVDVIALPLWLILATITLTTFLGLVSGIYPARRAARINPVDALRYE